MLGFFGGGFLKVRLGALDPSDGSEEGRLELAMRDGLERREPPPGTRKQHTKHERKEKQVKAKIKKDQKTHKTQ